jgi:hypothetical protein
VLTPVIPATQEAEIRRIEAQSQPGQIVWETLSQEKSIIKKSWWSGSRWKPWVQTQDCEKKAQPGMMVHACNPSIPEAERAHSSILSQYLKEKKKQFLRLILVSWLLLQDQPLGCHQCTCSKFHNFEFVALWENLLHSLYLSDALRKMQSCENIISSDSFEFHLFESFTDR